jgi:hypothetical protein
MAARLLPLSATVLLFLTGALHSQLPKNELAQPVLPCAVDLPNRVPRPKRNTRLGLEALVFEVVQVDWPAALQLDARAGGPFPAKGGSLGRVRGPWLSGKTASGRVRIRPSNKSRFRTRIFRHIHQGQTARATKGDRPY